MKKQIVSIAIIFLTAVCGGKQAGLADPRAPLVEDDFVAHSGIIPQSQEEYLKMEQAKMTRSFTDEPDALYKNLPPVVDMSSALPRVGDQGKQNSCTAWTLAYAVKSFQENREHGWGLDETHLFSPAFIYNQINHGADNGVDLVDAMDFLKDHGTVPLAMMAYDENDHITQPGENLKDIAKAFRSLGYRRLDETNIQLIKSWLAAEEPVIIVVEMYRNFLRSGMIRSKNVYQEKGGDAIGHHALVAVGYDNAKSAIKVLNSWGSRWGENGYGWIDEKFFPDVVKRAYLLYDTTTPQKSLARLQELQNRLPDEKLTAGGAAKEDDFVTVQPDRQTAQNKALTNSVGMNSYQPGRMAGPILQPQAKNAGEQLDDFLMIVPNEAGIAYGDDWLRLGEGTARSHDFFSEKTAPAFRDFNFAGDSIIVGNDFLAPDEIGFVHFINDARLPIFTNQGIGFGSDKKDVHRVYREPDHHDKESNTDTFFFHAITDEWGGIKITRHASLSFQYNDGQKVTYMSLGRVMKKAVTGQGFEKPAEGEQRTTGTGTAIEAGEGNVRFVIPKRFSDINKSVWEGTGLGYFAKNPDNMAEFLVVKVFFLNKPVTEQILGERITADLKTQNVSGATQKTESIAGIDWQVVTQDERNLRYYGAKGNFIYQIQMASDQRLSEQTWVGEFINSVSAY